KHAFNRDPSQGQIVGQLAIGNGEIRQIGTQPRGKYLHANCSRKRRSPEYSRPISLMPYFIIAIRSTPMPKAKPEIFFGSYAGCLPRTNSNTVGFTMPQPSNSIQPECLHLRQPLPPQKMQLICTSALGSVNGKNEGKNRVLTDEPNSAFIAWSSVPFRSLKVTLASTQSPSTWWKIGECVASAASLRCTLPGMTIRTGGGCCSIVRICTGDVWVRSSSRSRSGRCSCPAITSVSCVSRAGCPGGKFMLSKL